jgi:hypothetical protein
MAEETPKHTDIRFEPTDLSGRNVFLTGLGVLVGLWISAGLLFFVFIGLKHYRQEVAGVPLPIEAHGNVLPPEPRLQRSPREDLKRFEAQEDWELTHYHWLDKNRGVVAIPIEQAIQMTAQHGIPATNTPPNPTLTPPQAGMRDTGFEGEVEPEPR